MLPYICIHMKRELNFRPHPNGLGGVQCKIKTDNGYTISIVGGGIGLYGDGFVLHHLSDSFASLGVNGVTHEANIRQSFHPHKYFL